MSAPLLADITVTSLSFNALCAFGLFSLVTGMSKSGVQGVGTAAIPLLAMVYGGKLSAGVALPTLILADILAVAYYHRHADWSILWRLLPWAAGGVLIGTWFGQQIDDSSFRKIMGVIIFASLVIMIWLERGNKGKIPNHFTFTAVVGILGGFTTMVGNLAGPVMAVYLLSARLPKNNYIGTAAWFFLVINLFKVPFHVFVWQTINIDTLLLNLAGLPIIALGVYLGIWIVKKIPSQHYRWFIIATTAISAVFMVL
ncbi:sulfite exporter TauE/SafE family protein [Teredinibacter waterburyi]|jgi:Sulfite exporter TauE/SafE.|uniref:sulfite exporter TauE/SafE family protein n=1 Tax=Teredinibacter waterburyi TaxID=1500538 RepID=UPI00165FCAAE|nr:sulfite exporter TauE/SafE family protein [Teredinibacter waterburyi]